MEASLFFICCNDWSYGVFCLTCVLIMYIIKMYCIIIMQICGKACALNTVHLWKFLKVYAYLRIS